MNNATQELLRGVVERVTFHNDENGYTVAKLVPEMPARQLPHWRKEVTVVGPMAGVQVGESVELSGSWELHPQFGKQFAVAEKRTVLPATLAGVERYLGSGLIKGVGPVTAKRIVAHFGLDTLDVIEGEPDRLREVGGVGRKRVSMIRAGWEEMKAIKEVMIFLQGHGVGAGLAARIYKRYGGRSVEILQKNPYRLSQEMYGVGFLTADKIARALGMGEDAPQRVSAAAEHSLNQATGEGHVFLPSGELVRRAGDLLNLGEEEAATGVLRLKAADRVKIAPGPGAAAEELRWGVTDVYHPSDDASATLLQPSGPSEVAPAATEIEALLHGDRSVYLSPMYYAELGVSNHLRRQLAQGPGRLEQFQRLNWEGRLASGGDGGPRLVARQREAVRAALTHRLTVLTGGPGTGKTTVVRTIIQLCEEAGVLALLAAPTGRAAKRLAEATGRPAKTIHRLLQFQPSAGLSFKRNRERPLRGDLLIVDEASMLDLILANHLLKAAPEGMSLLFVGDIDQLPSVGAGNVLRDLIAAIEGEGDSDPPAQDASLWRRAAVVRLQTVFRQAAGSQIVENAHRVNRGEMPVLAGRDAGADGGDDSFFLFRTEAPERAAQLCVELVRERIPRRFDIPPREIQVLSPIHRGAAGVAQLNEALQLALNPARKDRPEHAAGNRVYRAGDRVMQMRNNYDKDVFNGDMGYIREVDPVEQRIAVEFDDQYGRVAAYDFYELDELALAYAVSVHKSQGSEFPAVVLPVLTSHYMMLQRNLLYTAITRAKRLVVLAGQPRAISIAVGNNKVAQRYSGLSQRARRAPEQEILV